MWGIVIVILIIIVSAIYSSFSKATDKVMGNTINNFENDKWWIIGAMADMHNKNKDKK